MEHPATSQGTALRMAGRRLLRLPQPIVWLAALVLIWIAVVLTGTWSQRARLAALRDRGMARLGLDAAVLEKELTRYDYLLAAVRLNTETRELLRNPGDPGSSSLQPGAHALERTSTCSSAV